MALLQGQRPAQQLGQLARDGQPQAGAAVTPIGGGVDLFEGGEHPLLIAGRDPQAGVGDHEGHRPLARQARWQRADAVALRVRPLDAQADATLGRELDGVAQQVVQDLLQAPAIGVQRRRQAGGHRDGERQILLARQRIEHPPQVLDHRLQGHRLVVHLLLAGFDARQIQHLVDQGQKIFAGGVDGPGELDLLVGEVARGVLGQQVRQQQHAVQRRAQLVRHVGQELRLVRADSGQLGGLVLQVGAGVGQLEVAGLQRVTLIFQLLGSQAQLKVGLAQLVLLGLQLFVDRPQLLFLRRQPLGLALRLGQKFARGRPRARAVQGDGQRVAHQGQELGVRVGPGPKQGQLQHADDAALARDRLEDQRGRRGLAQAGAHAQELRRRIRHHRQLLAQRGLAHQPLGLAKRRARVAGGGAGLDRELPRKLPADLVVPDVKRTRRRLQVAGQERRGPIRHLLDLQLAADLLDHAGLARFPPVGSLALDTEALQALRHLVGLPRHLAQLVGAGDGDGLLEVALGKTVQAHGQPAQRPQHTPAQLHGQQHHHHQAADDDGQALLRGHRLGPVRRREGRSQLAAIEGRGLLHHPGCIGLLGLHGRHPAHQRLAGLAVQDALGDVVGGGVVVVDRRPQRRRLHRVGDAAGGGQLAQQRLLRGPGGLQRIRVARRHRVLQATQEVLELRLQARAQLQARQVAALDLVQLALRAVRDAGAADEESDERQRRRRDDGDQTVAKRQPHEHRLADGHDLDAVDVGGAGDVPDAAGEAQDKADHVLIMIHFRRRDITA